MSRVAVGAALVTRTESSSRPGTFYTQMLDSAGHWSCDCPDYLYRERQCKHIEARKDELRAELTELRTVLRYLDTYGTAERVRERSRDLKRFVGAGELRHDAGVPVHRLRRALHPRGAQGRRYRRQRVLLGPGVRLVPPGRAHHEGGPLG